MRTMELCSESSAAIRVALSQGFPFFCLKNEIQPEKSCQLQSELLVSVNRKYPCFKNTFTYIFISVIYVYICIYVYKHILPFLKLAVTAS